MRLFVGLGNPGAKYASNRHNIGFMAVDAIKKAHGFGPWRGKFQGQLAEGRLGIEKVLLLKPKTYMNLSGHSVGAAAKFYKLAPDDIVVFHDDLDLAPGKCRVKTGGGHAGHNGLRSIHGAIGAAYVRVRLGIGHPGDKSQVSHYVLRDFAKADNDWLDELMRGIADGAPALAEGTSDRFLNAVAQRTRPSRSSVTAPSSKGPAKAPADTPAPGPKATDAPQPADTRSSLQKLIDRFR